MDSNRIKRLATGAREGLRREVEGRLDAVLAQGSAERLAARADVGRLEARITVEGRERVVDSAAYTWFNRLCALRFMDARGYTPVMAVTPRADSTLPAVLAGAQTGLFAPKYGARGFTGAGFRGFEKISASCYTLTQMPPPRGLGSESRSARGFTGAGFRALWGDMEERAVFFNCLPTLKQGETRIGCLAVAVSTKDLIRQIQAGICSSSRMIYFDALQGIGASQSQYVLHIFPIEKLVAAFEDEFFNTIIFESNEKGLEAFSTRSLLFVSNYWSSHDNRRTWRIICNCFQRPSSVSIVELSPVKLFRRRGLQGFEPMGQSHAVVAYYASGHCIKGGDGTDAHAFVAPGGFGIIDFISHGITSSGKRDSFLTQEYTSAKRAVA